VRRGTAAIVVSAAAFALYHATLLPGFDFGDTGSFQTTVGSAAITARDGYPLYFAIGQLFLWLTRAEPAHALNLASAVEAAAACGLVVLAAEELSGSIAAAVAATVIFAASYTFWSQAIIAEVYALHIAFVAAALLLMLRWQRRPSIARLSGFFAVYALGFGNHLSMIVLAPACTLFLLASAPRGWRSMFAPRIVGLAALFACLGAMQYAWNFEAVRSAPQPPHGMLDALARFWFDVTKSDWRDTMVWNVPRSMLADHFRMYVFDLRQQFGLLPPAVAAIGLGRLFRTDWRRGALLSLLYVASTLFAFSYNVGDTHVFYLPSHLYVALLIAPGLMAIGATASRIFQISPSRAFSSFRFAAAASVAIGCYGAVRIYRDYPALDRSNDSRPMSVMTALTAGLDDRHAILLTDMNWQVMNGLSYFGKEVHSDLGYARMPDVLLYAPVLVADNLAIGREVTATSRARQQVAAAYGPLLPTESDPRVPVGTLNELVGGLPMGTMYALCALKPTREFSVDRADLVEALRTLSGGSADAVPAGQYAVIVGRTGERPLLAEGEDDPFRRSVSLAGIPIEVRMESWLSADTIRRMGFGHIIAARQHTLIVERGISFVAFDGAGRPLRSGYRSSIFAPQSRYLIKIGRDIVAP
jgi:hypothetical protein